MSYSKLTGWEVYNFMSYEHGRVDFDDRNIVNIKGYNDSGKSAMLTALRVLMTNSNASKQVNFIKDDKDYFRIIAYFDDGVVILRDKYRNGASLYEMYKNDNLIFTTKSGNALTVVKDVPEPIRQYLGLIGYEKEFMNFRSCFQPLIGVDTKGSENYKMFNTVLKAEELARAGEMLNADKNKLNNEITNLQAEIEADKAVIGRGKFITECMCQAMGILDNAVSSDTERKQALSGIMSTAKLAHSINIAPELRGIDISRASRLNDILKHREELNDINIAPELRGIDTTQFNKVTSIKNMMSQGIAVAPELKTVSISQLNALTTIRGIVSQIELIDKNISGLDSQLEQTEAELSKTATQVKQLGGHIVKCPHCGSFFDENSAHTHNMEGA